MELRLVRKQFLFILLIFYDIVTLTGNLIQNILQLGDIATAQLYGVSVSSLAF